MRRAMLMAGLAAMLTAGSSGAAFAFDAGRPPWSDSYVSRLQALALSIAHRAGAPAVPAFARLMDVLEEAGDLDRKTEGLATAEDFARRATGGQGLTRPELAVLLSSTKLVLQRAHGLFSAPAGRVILAHQPAIGVAPHERHRRLIPLSEPDSGPAQRLGPVLWRCCFAGS